VPRTAFFRRLVPPPGAPWPRPARIPPAVLLAVHLWGPPRARRRGRPPHQPGL